MANNSSSSSGGVGFIGLLTLVFVVFKLANFIDWSWWLVFSPVLVCLGIIVAILSVAGLVLLLEK